MFTLKAIIFISDSIGIIYIFFLNAILNDSILTLKQYIEVNNSE